MTAPGAPFDPDALRRDPAARFAQLRDKAEAVRSRLAETTATAAGGDGAVTVTVGVGGIMRSIRFEPRAQHLPAEQLSSAVMRAYGQACREAAAESQRILGTLVGPDSPTLQLMRDAVPRTRTRAANTRAAGDGPVHRRPRRAA